MKNKTAPGTANHCLVKNAVKPMPIAINIFITIIMILN